VPTYRAGRHEFGQNFLTDRRVIATMVDLVRRTCGPIIEFGPGRGALTFPLQCLGRPITAVEIDEAHARHLRPRVAADTTIVRGDFLRYRLPQHPHVLVGNLPFELTTAVLRRILHAPTWQQAVLMTQWEVARRRAAVGGATMMTAQWWPWFEFSLVERVPAAAFTPRPSVDGGLLTIRRREHPLVPCAQQKRYKAFVHAVFTGTGHGLPQILPRVVPSHRRGQVRRWLDGQRFRRRPLPRDLSSAQWAELFTLAMK